VRDWYNGVLCYLMFCTSDSYCLIFHALPIAMLFVVAWLFLAIVCASSRHMTVASKSVEKTSLYFLAIIQTHYLSPTWVWKVSAMYRARQHAWKDTYATWVQHRTKSSVSTSHGCRTSWRRYFYFWFHELQCLKKIQRVSLELDR
jgi:hypothetical protein